MLKASALPSQIPAFAGSPFGASLALRRARRNPVCAVGVRCPPRGRVLSRPCSENYRGSLRPCLGTAIAPRRQAGLRQALLGDRDLLLHPVLPVTGDRAVEVVAAGLELDRHR